MYALGAATALKKKNWEYSLPQLKLIVISFIVLTWLGAKPAEQIFVCLAQFVRFIYFGAIILR